MNRSSAGEDLCYYSDKSLDSSAKYDQKEIINILSQSNKLYIFLESNTYRYYQTEVNTIVLG